ncbi:MAG: hypothetical protein JWQ98_1484 [Chlorobi bacterium]|nr:hypothetical protein [Chlorobiota bacterium]
MIRCEQPIAEVPKIPQQRLKFIIRREVIAILNEIQFKLESGKKAHEVSPKSIELSTKFAVKLTLRDIQRLLRFGGYKIAERLHLHKIQLPIHKGTSAELTSCGKASPTCNGEPEYLIDDQLVSMKMQLHHILAGKRGGTFEPNGHATIQSIATDGYDSISQVTGWQIRQ